MNLKRYIRITDADTDHNMLTVPYGTELLFSKLINNEYVKTKRIIVMIKYR